eukprot:gene10814-12796_t
MELVPIKGWLFIDLVSVLPWSELFSFIIAGHNSWGKVPSFFKLIRLTRLLKVLKVAEGGELFKMLMQFIPATIRQMLMWTLMWMLMWTQAIKWRADMEKKLDQMKVHGATRISESISNLGTSDGPKSLDLGMKVLQTVNVQGTRASLDLGVGHCWHYFQLHPLGLTHRLWDGITFCVLVFLLFYLPVRVAFVDDGSDREQEIDFIISVVFVIDIVVNFMTGVVLFDADKEEEYISFSFRDIWIKQLLKLGYGVALLAHYVACCWHYIAVEQNNQGKATWMGIYFEKEADDVDFAERYVTSLYWSLTTITTVGYGDVLPYTKLEKVLPQQNLVM